MMSGPESAAVDVCALTDIPSRGSRVLKTEAGCVALFRTFSDEVFALHDHCPHLGGPLSQGIVHDRAVTCPLHNLVLDLDTGKARGPEEGSVRTFPVEVRGGRVLVDLRGFGTDE